MKKRIHAGFTLYELLVTLLIVGVVLTLGVPNLSNFARNSRVTSTSNDLHSTFHMARSAAARAKTNITICASADSMTDAADCGGTWDQGYIVFIDDNADQQRNAVGETVLRAVPESATGITLAVEDDATYFMFASSGLGRRDVANNVPVSRVMICDDRGIMETSENFSAARLFVATPLGRATIIRDLTTVDNALLAMGKSCP
jgi:type IV fimbrial biogenesis protein FimT